MLGIFRGERSVRERKRREAAVRRGHRPALEGLEPRIAMSTDIWTGAANDGGQWMTPDNWQADTAPVAGDDLEFPAGVSPSDMVNNNNFSGGISFNSITIGGSGYTLSGNTLTLGSGGITASYSSGTSTIAIDMPLSAATTTISVASGGTLDIPNVLSPAAAGSNAVNVGGGGTLDLSGLNKYTGLTTVASGTTLYVDGTLIGGVQADGVLGGNGTVNTVDSVGGTISPGHTVPGTPAPGQLTVSAPPGSTTGASLTLDSNSTFATDLDGTSPGNGSTGYGQVVVSAAPSGATAGGVNLGGATLAVTLDPGYTPSPGDALTIIDNETGASVNGLFAGLAEGGAVATGTGGSQLFRISYAGGATGNADNVVLTAVSGASTTTLLPITTPVTYGQSVTLTADVAGVTNNGTPTGTVEFFDGSPTAGGVEIGSATLSGGSASTSVSDLSVSGSPHEIYALYVPTSTSYTYAGSTSSGQSVTVNPATLTVTGVVGENKQYDATTTATIDTTGATLVGVVPGDVGNVTLNTTDVTAAFTSPNVGTNVPITVTGLSLSGTASTNYVLLQPTGVTASITPAPLTLTANDQTMDQGGTVPTLTYTATGLQGTDTTAVLTTQPTLSTTATSTSPAGTYPINITGGSAQNYTITDVPGTLTVVTSYATTTTLTTSSQLAVVGQPVTFTATVAPVSSGAGTPTGSVAFVVDSTTLLGIEPLNSTDQASITTSSLGFGTHSIQAVYLPSNSFEESESTALTQYVSSAGTTPTLTIVPVRNKHGQVKKFDLVAQVEPTSPGAGTPTGTVTYFINARAFYRSVFLSDGTSVLTVLQQRLANRYVYVRYNGTQSYIASSSPNVYISNRKLVLLARSGNTGGLRVASRREHPGQSR